MAYEDKNLSKLMEEIRQKRPSVAETDTDHNDPLYDLFHEEVAEKPKAVDLDACIKGALESLQSYHLCENAQNIIREFLTFRVLTQQALYDQPEARRAYYNLLLHSNEQENIRHVAELLRQALNIPQKGMLIRTEAELLQQLETATRTGKRTPATLIPIGTEFILIDACQDAPRLNLDGGSAIRDASKKAIENYHAVWDTVLSHIRENPYVILVIGCDEDVYRSTMLPNTEISQRLCSHHIHLAPQTEEDLLADCMAELRNSSFTLAEDFEPALSKYFHGAYRTSDLHGQAFVADLLDQIYAQYYMRPRKERRLTADCVPALDPQIHSAEHILGQMEQLVGLQTVKTEFRNMFKLQMAGLIDPGITSYHMLFSGNPGTGKTTVARMAADLFFRMGVLKTNKLVSVKPSDLVSEWIGGTGMKAMEVIRRAYNGVLFIDEAYGIANMSRGDELLNVLLQEMENHADKLVVIFAGYTGEMRELLKANPGLGSRIGQEIHFADYSLEELAEIFRQMCKKDGFSVDPSAQDEMEDCIAALMTREFFGNARDIRNMLQDLKEIWSEDFYIAVTEQGMDPADVKRIFLPHHFEKIMPPKKEVSIQDLVGLDVLKNKLEVFKRQALYQKHLREKGFADLSDFSMHMIFTGNPGTGKSTVARLIADDLYSIGMLKTNRLVMVERKDLIDIHGNTAKKTADVIRQAVGGVLFIDEAYALSDGRYGNNDCIEVLLTAMEAHKADTVFVFAGYVEQMQDFLAANPGIQSRIGYTFHFDDYSPEDLTNMYAEKMRKTGFVVSESALDKVREIMEYFQDVKNFGNGRFVNHVIHQTISQRANREFENEYRDIRAQDIPTIKALIETAPNSMHLYDPATITPEAQRRTAIHELGHAMVMAELDPSNIPENISIRNQAGSFGRVTFAGGQVKFTEEQFFHRIASLLGGKNAEKVVFGTHSTGCASDYARAKRIAQDMVEVFAMTTYGDSPNAIIQAADKLSLQILENSKENLLRLCPELMERKELSGEEFNAMR